MTYIPNPFLALIDPSTRHPEVETCAQIKARSPISTVTIHPALPRHQYPHTQPLETLTQRDPGDLAGVIILGGGASPLTSSSWRDRLIEWLTAPDGPMQKRLPMLGICYGHQLLGYLAGGQIINLWEGEAVKGIRDVTFCEPTLGLIDQRAYPLIVSHREGLTSPPQGWKELTRPTKLTGPCGTLKVRAVEVMKHEQLPWWGFQAHIDATDEFIIQNQIPTPLPPSYAGWTIIEQFLELLT